MSAVTQACEIEGEGLLLRPCSVADVPQLELIGRDPEIMRWNPIVKPTIEEWVARRADWSAGDHASWLVVSSDDRVTVRGAVSLHHIDHEQANSEIGYWVAPDHRGAAVASRAARVASRWGFEVLELRRVYLFHAIGNEGSCRAALGAGFRYEGTHRQSYRFADGKWHDEHSHARLSDDRD